MSMDLVVITGMSGSGKSIALGALEDAGYYCVDNLPPELLEPFLALEDRLRARKVAIAMDVRSGESLPQLPLLLHGLRDKGLSLRQIFLDANDHTLVMIDFQSQMAFATHSIDAVTLRNNAALVSHAAAGFGVVFNVSARVLIFCAAGGAIGRGLRFLLVETDLGMPIAWATFVAAASVSLASV